MTMEITPSVAELYSSLAKIRLDGPTGRDQVLAPDATAWLLQGGRYSFQLGLRLEAYGCHYVRLDLGQLPQGIHATVRAVKQVPVALAAYPDARDEDYIDHEPGLYPDLLQTADPSRLEVRGGLWESFWIELEADLDAPAFEGDLHVSVVPLQFPLRVEEGQTVAAESSETLPSPLLDRTLRLCVSAQPMPEQSLIFTNWFHADGIADHYGVEAWSERHWELVRRQVRAATKRGMNMILTPVLTPPLDTAIGSYRTCVQLVDVTREKDGTWQFGFDRLDRWVAMCLEEGIGYFEINHLFTQWGANACPQVRGVDHANDVTPEGFDHRQDRSPRSQGALDQLPLLFGWHTPSLGGEWADFLQALLPALLQRLETLGVKDQTWFHVSDEPSMAAIEKYQACKALVEPYIEGRPIMDALSDYEFYATGAVDTPIPATNHIVPFLEHEVPDLWTYYCCGQNVDVSNRFHAMPSARNRILGVQMYVGRIVGFLHWGYNFYLSQFSGQRINPYLIPDAHHGFPAGDAYVVYPAADGEPEESLRWVVFGDGLDDLRLLQALEKLEGRDQVLELIRTTAAENGANEEEQALGFFKYPKEEAFLLQLREKICARLDAAQH